MGTKRCGILNGTEAISMTLYFTMVKTDRLTGFQTNH